MSKSKAAAKAVATSPAAPKEWPDLSDAQANALFMAVESGLPIKKAATDLGHSPGAVYQWKHRYPKFGARMDEALAIGYDMILDELPEIADRAIDKNSAAAAAIKIQAREKYLQGKHPQRFKTSPFKALTDGGNEVLIGVVVVPAKQALLPHDVVDAEFTEIDVPAKVPA